MKSLSAPLFALIHNGQMRESLSGTAEMEDIEVGTFVAFCEFGYRGRYKTPSRTCEEEEDGESPTKQEGPNQSVRISDSQSAQIDSEESQSDREQQPSQAYIFEKPFGHFHIPPSGCSPEREHFEPKAASTFVISPSRRRLRQFEFLEFPGEEAVKAHNPDFLAHAKIYIFATRYLVDSLREQCLKSLHRDLCEFTLNARNMSHFLDLLQYTFEHTGRQEPDGISSLRRVVIDYTSCKAKYLVKSARFRQILDTFGEIGSDLVAKLVQ